MKKKSEVIKEQVIKLFEEGKSEEAVKLLQKELAKKPDDFWVAWKLADYYARPMDAKVACEYFLRASRIYSKLGKPVDACLILQQALERLRQDPEQTTIQKELDKVNRKIDKLEKMGKIEIVHIG